jgi:hypothetical protein
MRMRGALAAWLVASADALHAIRTVRPRIMMSAEPVTKKDARKLIMTKDEFIRSPQEFKAEKQAVDAMMLAEFKVGRTLLAYCGLLPCVTPHTPCSCSRR